MENSDMDELGQDSNVVGDVQSSSSSKTKKVIIVGCGFFVLLCLVCAGIGLPMIAKLKEAVEKLDHVNEADVAYMDEEDEFSDAAEAQLVDNIDFIAPLRRRIGTWSNKIVQKKSTWNPQQITVMGEENIQWILDNKFIQGDTTMEDGTKGHWLMTYDPEAKVYRNWFFSNTSFPKGDSIGRWNSELEQMEFEFEVDENLYGQMRFQFMNDNKLEWEVTIHDDGGQLMMETVGVQTRIR